jgi:hypothetical protein
MASPTIAAPSPTPQLLDYGITKLMKVFAKTKWDKSKETYPEWKESIMDTLGFVPKALAQYRDELPLQMILILLSSFLQHFLMLYWIAMLILPSRNFQN